MPRIIMIRGPEQGRVYDLKGDTVNIGRGRKNDIIIRDYEVSREHCRMVRVLDQYELHDLNSSNGTFVNGHPVDERGWLLDSKSLIELGESITLEYIPDEAEPSPAAKAAAASPAEPVAADHIYYLVVKTSPEEAPAVYPLNAPTVTVGRGLDNDIVVQAPEVSRNHLRLTLVPTGYVVEDLNSTNGTFIRGKKLEGPHLLRLDDMLLLGHTVEVQYTGKPENMTSQYKTKIIPGKGSEDPTHDRRLAMQLGTKRFGQEVEGVDSDHGLDPGELVGHVFVAYGREDWAPMVVNLFGYLRDNGIKAWTDQYLTEGSENWEAAIEQALTECALLVAVISPQSLEREYVRRSIRHFLNREKPVILFNFQKVERLPMSAQRLPAIWYSPANPTVSYQQLISRIKEYLNNS